MKFMLPWKLGLIYITVACYKGFYQQHWVSYLSGGTRSGCGMLYYTHQLP